MLLFLGGERKTAEKSHNLIFRDLSTCQSHTGMVFRWFGALVVLWFHSNSAVLVSHWQATTTTNLVQSRTKVSYTFSLQTRALLKLVIKRICICCVWHHQQRRNRVWEARIRISRAKGEFLVFNHLNWLLDLVRLCLDLLFRRLWFRWLNWNSLRRGFLIFNHLNRLLDLALLCHDRLLDYSNSIT